MKTRTFIRTVVAMLALMGLIVPACFAGGGQEGGKAEITFWQHSYPPLNAWTKKHIEGFMAKNPGITVKFELVPFEEYIQKVFTALATKQAPEVFESDDFTFAQFIQNKALHTIDPVDFGYPNLEKFTAAFEGNSLKLVTVQGKVYAIPYDWEAPVIGYNINIFKKAGINPKSLTSWDLLGAAAQKMAVHDSAGVLTTAGMCFVHNIGEYYQHIGNTLFRQARVSILDEAKSACALNVPDARRVFQLWNDMIFKYKADKPGFTGSFYTEEFGQGRVAMGWMLTWANSILAPHNYKKGRDFDLIPVPTFAGGDTGTISSAWNWVINASISDAKARAATKFLAYKSDQGDSFLVDAGLVSPKKGWKEKVSAEQLKLYDEIFNSLGRSRPHDSHPKYQEIWKPIMDVFQACEVDAGPDIPALLAECEKKINAIVK
jgi:multiple sugar transport system substrate-binding protein